MGPVPAGSITVLQNAPATLTYGGSVPLTGTITSTTDYSVQTGPVMLRTNNPVTTSAGNLCPAGSFTVDGADPAVSHSVSSAAPASWSGFTLHFNELPGNQNDCLGATVTIKYKVG